MKRGARLKRAQRDARLDVLYHPGMHLKVIAAGARMLPDFIIIGAQKAGTSSLYKHLVRHPCIAPAVKKEVHFFDNHFDRGFRWYRTHFPMRIRGAWFEAARGKRLLTGEATPNYLPNPLAPERVRRTLPRAKFIALLRNPVDRAYSHYQMRVRNGGERLTFEETVKIELGRRSPESSRRKRPYRHLSRGYYAEQLERWLGCLPRERLLILQSERFFARPQDCLEQVYAFLGIAARDGDRFENTNPGKYAPMSPETRRGLMEHFSPWNERLYELVGERFEWNS